MEQIAAGQLMKSVPAIPQFGEMLLPHTPRELILRAISSSPSHYPYAWWTEREGFCGITPETLFHQQGRRLETMALAGTARPEDEGVFINDDKEIREQLLDVFRDTADFWGERKIAFRCFYSFL